VRIWEPRDLPDEVREKARCEVGTRTQRSCEQCGTVVPYARVELPELLYLTVQAEEGEKAILEGWALRGSFAVTFHPCPECDEPGWAPPAMSRCSVGRRTSWRH